MDKTEALSRLTFCCECGYWKRGYSNELLRHPDKVGICDKPCESRTLRMDDDFCSNGRKKDDSLC